MELPPELVLVLSGVIGFLVAEGLKSIGALFGVDLSGFATALTAAIVAAAVASINGLLLQVPPELVPFVRGLLAFLVIVFAPPAVHDLLTKRAG